METERDIVAASQIPQLMCPANKLCQFSYNWFVHNQTARRTVAVNRNLHLPRRRHIIWIDF